LPFPVPGRSPNHERPYYASFSYQAGSWDKKRRVVAKVEWHPGELVPRVGFVVTNLSRPLERVTKFYQGRGTAEQWIKARLRAKPYATNCPVSEKLGQMCA
jgi:hypothetical protein